MNKVKPEMSERNRAIGEWLLTGDVSELHWIFYRNTVDHDIFDKKNGDFGVSQIEVNQVTTAKSRAPRTF